MSYQLLISPKIKRRGEGFGRAGWLRGRRVEAFLTCEGKATAPLRGAAGDELQQEMQLTPLTPGVPPPQGLNAALFQPSQVPASAIDGTVQPWHALGYLTGLHLRSPISAKCLDLPLSRNTFRPHLMNES